MIKKCFENIGLTILGVVLLVLLTCVLFGVHGFLLHLFSIEFESFLGIVLGCLCMTPLILLYTLTWDNPPKERKYILFISCWFFVLLQWGWLTLSDRCAQFISVDVKSLRVGGVLLAFMCAGWLFRFLNEKIEQKNNGVAVENKSKNITKKTIIKWVINFFGLLGFLFLLWIFHLISISSYWKEFCQPLGMTLTGVLTFFLTLGIPAIILWGIMNCLNKKFHLDEDKDETLSEDTHNNNQNLPNTP